MTDREEDRLAPGEGLVVNKWIAGIFAAVIASGAVAFFASYNDSQTQAAVFAVQLEAIQAALRDIRDDFAGLRASMGDRWTGQQQAEYAAAAKADRDAIRGELQRHVALPWHREAGAEHAETRRRVDRIEARLDQLSQDLRELEKALKTR